MSGAPEPLLLTVRDAAALLGIGRDATYELVREGRLRTLQLGRKILVPRVELARFVERELEGAVEREAR